MAHSGRAAGGPPLPPQRRSLQQRFGPHAKARNGRGTVRRLLALYARWKRELILVVGLTVLSTVASLAVPYLLGLWTASGWAEWTELHWRRYWFSWWE